MGFDDRRPSGLYPGEVGGYGLESSEEIVHDMPALPCAFFVENGHEVRTRRHEDILGKIVVLLVCEDVLEGKDTLYRQIPG